MARRAGVSSGTVSNVLNRPERVAEATRLRVEAAIRDLGFVRNGSASTLRAGQSRVIGLVVLDVGNPFFTEAARGVEDVVSSRGHSVILTSSGGAAEKERHSLHVLAEQRVRGVLITPAGDDETALEALRARGVAVVLLDRPAVGGDLCSVAVDDEAGGELAVRHLIEQGARHIAFVNGPESIRQCRDRLHGARRAASGSPARLDELPAVEMTALGGTQAAEALLAGGPRPDAIFCANDLMALGVLRTLLQAGIRVPDDVRLVGYDDIEFTAAAAVPLSSVRQPTYQLGAIATELLLDECEDPRHAHRQVMFQPELVVRESSTRNAP